MKQFLLDTSVLLDLFMNRLPRAMDMATIWDAHRQGKIRALVAAFALPTIFYIVRRQAGLTAAQTVVQACLSTLDVAPVDRTTLLAAEARSGPDFGGPLRGGRGLYSDPGIPGRFTGVFNSSLGRAS